MQTLLLSQKSFEVAFTELVFIVFIYGRVINYATFTNVLHLLLFKSQTANSKRQDVRSMMYKDGYRSCFGSYSVEFTSGFVLDCLLLMYIHTLLFELK